MLICQLLQLPLQIEFVLSGSCDLFVKEFLLLELFVVFVLVSVELFLLLVALVVDLVALVFEPVPFSLPVKDFLFQFHLVEVLISRLLEFSVVGMDVVHFALESVKEILSVQVDRVSHFVYDLVNALVHLFEALVDVILGCHFMVELLLGSHSELLSV